MTVNNIKLKSCNRGFFFFKSFAKEKFITEVHQETYS